MTVEQRLDQLEKPNKRLTVALTMMAMVAITIQLSGCGEDPAGPSTNCDVSMLPTIHKHLYNKNICCS